jgi:hypothetical protein
MVGKVPGVGFFLTRLLLECTVLVSAEIDDLSGCKGTRGGVGLGDSFCVLGGVVDLPKKFFTLLKNPYLMQLYQQKPTRK